MAYEKFEGLDLIADEYKKAVAKSLLINELGGSSMPATGYELSHAKKGQSGWSFGGNQMDLSKGKGVALLKDIVIHELGSDYWTPELEASLIKANDPNSITTTIKNQINNALSSDYGKSQINASFVSEVSYLTDYANKVEIELQKINPNIELSLGEKLMIIDFKNQYGLSLDNTVSGSMLKKMQDYIEVNADITPEAIKELFKTTSYYKDLVADENYAQVNRVNNTYNAAIQLDSSNLQQTTIIDESGNKTNLYYSEYSDLLMYGDTIDNPNKISFVNEDGSYEVWEKVNGEFTQTVKVDENMSNNNYDMGSIIDVGQHIYDNLNQGLLTDDIYQTISKNISDYIVGYSGTTSLTDIYFNDITPTDIGAFYESTTNQDDKKVSFIKFKNTIRFYQANLRKVA